MKVSSPPLLPILRSRVQGDLLALLYLHPEETYSLTEVSEYVSVTLSAVNNEATRLERAGYILGRRVGRTRQVSAATDTLVYGPLRDLLLVTFGPRAVLGGLLAGVGGVREAFVYGSWAARYEGLDGGLPNDVDVLVVGDADLDALDELSVVAERRLRRPVTIQRVRERAWRDWEGDPFLRTVRGRPLVSIPGVSAGPVG